MGEELRLLLVDVEAKIADAPRFEPGDHRARVDEGAATRVDQHDPRLHLLDGMAVDQVGSLGQQRAVQGDDVGLGEEALERDVVGAERLHPLVREGVGGQQAAAEAGEDLGRGGADDAGADDAHRAAVQVEAEQAVEREVAVAHAVVGPVDLAVQREDERDCVLGDGVRRVRRHADDPQAEAGPPRPGRRC